MTITLDDVVRLEEIEGEILRLLNEARSILDCGDDHIRDRAESYWVSQIKTALNRKHDYVGDYKCTCTLEETREELLQALENGEEDDDEGKYDHDEKERHACETDGWNEHCEGCHHAHGGCPFDE